MARSFPELVVDPDSYLCEIEHNGAVFPGMADLEANVPSRIHLGGEFRDRSGEASVGFFQSEDDVPLLKGRLWSGYDLVAVDCRVQTLMPGRTLVSPRFVLVGLRTGDVSDNAYAEMTIQATGLDLLFGRAPLQAQRWPSDSNRHLEGEFVAVGDPESTQEWTDGNTKVSCHYWGQQSSFQNPFAFEVRFAPVVSIEKDKLQSVDDWIREFVAPLMGLLNLATRRSQTISWITFEQPTKPPADGTERRHLPMRSQLFGNGISQVPYMSEDASAWMDVATRPVFELASSGISLPHLLRAWRGLEAGNNPFVELFRLATLRADFPSRALFLYLVQALESLHSYEHRTEEEEAATRYQKRRTSTIDRVRTRGAADDEIQFLKNSWSTQPRDDLARRLRALIRHDGLPDVAHETVETLRSSSIFAEVSVPGVEEAIRQIRNDLAHGNRNYAPSNLNRWNRVLDALCRAHLMRLLECPPESIERAFHLPDQ